MARSSPTQQKRQRENKLREKAQLKRELRQQRQAEKRARALEDPASVEPSVSAGTGNATSSVEITSTGVITMEAVNRYQGSAGWTSNPADSEHRT
jgi:hypothetical protein